MKKLNKVLMLCLCAILFTGCGQKKDAAVGGENPANSVENTSNSEENTSDSAETTEKTELLVAAAASLTDVTAEIAARYKEIAPNVSINFTYGSSGALQTQIEEGAPADLFISAATKQMEALSEQNLIVADTKTDLLLNKVVLITPKANIDTNDSFDILAQDTVKTVAIGDPASVPAGQYAEKILTNLGIWNVVKTKANFGTDVRQVLTWVEMGEVEYGIVYATDAAISEDVNVVCEAPEGTSDPIIYPAAVLEGSEHKEEASAFIEYLKGEECMALFEKYGFASVE